MAASEPIPPLAAAQLPDAAVNEFAVRHVGPRDPRQIGSCRHLARTGATSPTNPPLGPTDVSGSRGVCGDSPAPAGDAVGEASGRGSVLGGPVPLDARLRGPPLYTVLAAAPYLGILNIYKTGHGARSVYNGRLHLVLVKRSTWRRGWRGRVGHGRLLVR